MCYGNLRGIREAGRVFALPTYLFSASMSLMILVGLARESFGDVARQHVTRLPRARPTSAHGTMPPDHRSPPSSRCSQPFANGGSSLTGIEAVSNAVSALRPPEGRNARRVLVTQGLILDSLVAGISWLAHVTHATPYIVGYPTVMSQEASLVFGSAGHFLFYLVQAATALILFTGGNTSFNGFPFLTSFVAAGLRSCPAG